MVNLPPYGEKTDLPLGCKSQGYKYPNNYFLKKGLLHETRHISKRKLSLSLSLCLSLYIISLLNTDLTVEGAFFGKNTRGRPSCRTRRGRVIIARLAVP